jgi:hypothetical protein
LCPITAADDVLRQSRDGGRESSVIHVTHGMAVASISSPPPEGYAMDMSQDFQPVYPRHDLMIELGQVEMDIDGLSEREDSERDLLQPNLESRLQSLLDALDHLAV